MANHEQTILSLPALADIFEFLAQNQYPFLYTDLVQNHLIKDIGYVESMTKVGVGSVEYTFLEMNRILLVDQCKKEIVALKRDGATQTDRTKCDRCNIFYFHDHRNSAHVCPRCGVTVQLHGTDEVYNITNGDRYNKNPIHHYTPSEHFYQTLLDITCTGRRKVPEHVMLFCRCVLGRGTHITHTKVFRALQAGGYSKHYASRYEISCRLRGTTEIQMTRREMDMVRMHYKRYSKHISTFQREHGLGSVSSRGRIRMYWPVRFVMAEMFKLIGRDDLIKHLRGVAGKSRAVGYIKHWRRLREWVDHAEPTGHSGHAPVQMPALIRPGRSRRGRR